MRDDMIKKTRRNWSSTESSSSEEAEPSKPPKDVLELGKHLVRELKLHDGVDTLGRWMAHHVAELITDAKRQRKGPKRTRAEKEATELILKIWEHREALPRHAYPLAQYEEL